MPHPPMPHPHGLHLSGRRQRHCHHPQPACLHRQPTAQAAYRRLPASRLHPDPWPPCQQQRHPRSGHHQPPARQMMHPGQPQLPRQLLHRNASLLHGDAVLPLQWTQANGVQTPRWISPGHALCGDSWHRVTAPRDAGFQHHRACRHQIRQPPHPAPHPACHSLRYPSTS